MTALFIVVAVCCVLSVAYTSYRLGKEDGYLEGWQAAAAAFRDANE